MSFRTFHGPVETNGVCPVTIENSRGTREAISIAGVFAGNPILDPANMAQILPVLQGKLPSVTFMGVGPKGASTEVVSYTGSGSIEINGTIYPSKNYLYIEKFSDMSNRYSSIWTFIDNPNDPLSPIFVKGEPSTEPAASRATLGYALDVTFLSGASLP